MKKITFILAAMVLVSTAMAQVFQNRIGKSTPREFGYWLTQPLDSTYLVGGSYTNTFNSKEIPAIIHLTKTGTVDWSRQITVPGTGSAYVKCIEAVSSTTGTKDGYIAVVGGGNGEIYVTRLTNTGTLTWAKKLTTTVTSFSTLLVSRIKPVYSSSSSLPSYYILAYDYSDKGQLILKLNSNGDFIWQKKIIDPTADMYYNFFDLDVTKDSGCIVVGYEEGGAGTSNTVAMRFTKTGSIRWAKKFVFSSSLYSGGRAIAASGADFVITGSESRGKDNLTFKISASGTLQWVWKIVTGGANEITGMSVATDASGGIIIGGAQYSPLVQNAAFLMKMTPGGSINFSKEYYSNFNMGRVLNNANGYAFAGTAEPGNVATDIFVVQTNKSGAITSGCVPVAQTYTRVFPDLNIQSNAPYNNLIAQLSNVSVSLPVPAISTSEVRCGSASLLNNEETATAAVAEKKGTLTAFAGAGFSNITVQYKVDGQDNNNYGVKLFSLSGEVYGTASLKANQPVLFPATKLQEGLYMVVLTLKGVPVAQQKIMMSK